MPKHHRRRLGLRIGCVAPGGSSPGSRLRKIALVDSQAHIETHQNTVVNVRDGAKASFWPRRGSASGPKGAKSWIRPIS
jgi:hypothetical protein